MYKYIYIYTYMYIYIYTYVYESTNVHIIPILVFNPVFRFVSLPDPLL